MSLDIDLYVTEVIEEEVSIEGGVYWKFGDGRLYLADLIDKKYKSDLVFSYLQKSFVERKKETCVYSDNITHNLGRMAEACGIYDAMWRPYEHGFVYAKDIVEILEFGLSKLEADPEFYSQYNSPNGWGMYEHFVPFVRNYLNACKEYPEAELRASR